MTHKNQRLKTGTQTKQILTTLIIFLGSDSQPGTINVSVLVQIKQTGYGLLNLRMFFFFRVKCWECAFEQFIFRRG